MTRPIITLQEWLDKEKTIKIRFIQHELNPLNPTGLLTSQIGGNGEIHIFDRIQNNPPTEKASLNGNFIKISKFCFDKLKPKFRTFKNKEKDSSLIKKQYKLSKETVNSIKIIKEKYSFPREEHVIENIITGHINDKNIQRKIEKLKPKEIELEAFKSIIDSNKQEIFDLDQKNKNLEYKIKYITHLLATSYLKNEHLEGILLENELTSEYSILPEEKIKNKIFEINKLLKESF
ncbi:hypothetical protein [Acinetobacter sp. YH01020]|uniref:hypothetical protein n=1 Tax=Acinetobacter sp. YH01020 TaxID=2601034 RepID=UPI0015D11771|nr:hypothetical protein [Acinetobacter sp. YH01020]